MTLALGCIADDYTGASDLANTLTRQGLRTVQTIGVPPDDLALPEVDAVVVSLKSRSIQADVAVERSRAADKWLRGRGAGHVLFKICSTFDSTDAGNIGPVMDALRTDCGEGIVLVTPAFPETGRTVYQGNLFVGAVPLIMASGAGAEARIALGWVLVGGLGLATVVTLYLTPVAYLVIARFTKPQVDEERRLQRELEEAERLATLEHHPLPQAAE